MNYPTLGAVCPWRRSTPGKGSFGPRPPFATLRVRRSRNDSVSPRSTPPGRSLRRGASAFLAALREQGYVLPDHVKDSLEFDSIVANEHIVEAIQSLPKHKMPGDEGFPSDFYRTLLCQAASACTCRYIPRWDSGWLAPRQHAPIHLDTHLQRQRLSAVMGELPPDHSHPDRVKDLGQGRHHLPHGSAAVSG